MILSAQACGSTHAHMWALLHHKSVVYLKNERPYGPLSQHGDLALKLASQLPLSTRKHAPPCPRESLRESSQPYTRPEAQKTQLDITGTLC